MLMQVALDVNRQLAVRVQDEAARASALAREKELQRRELTAEAERRIRAVLGSEVDSYRIQNAIVSSNIALLTDQQAFEDEAQRLAGDLRASQSRHAATAAALHGLEARAAAEVAQLVAAEAACHAELQTMAAVVDRDAARAAADEANLEEETRAATRCVCVDVDAFAFRSIHEQQRR
jgi:hypothetical protein